MLVGGSWEAISLSTQATGLCVAASEQPPLWHQPGDSYSACGRFRSKLNPGAPACPDSRPVATMPPARARLAEFLEASIDTAQFPSLERQRSDRSVASQRPSAFESSRVRPKWVLGRPPAPAHFPDEPYSAPNLKPFRALQPRRARECRHVFLYSRAIDPSRLATSLNIKFG